MSPEFVQTASSAELAGIVMGEPAVAARVMATVNSPLYGLQQPVQSIGQATTFLGLATVRRLCLQYLLAESFKPRDAAQQREFEVLWRASSMAGELCQHLAQRLRLPEPGALATLLVLSFVGRQAAVALLPDAGALAGLDAHQRALHEQSRLGLPAHELGLLLMQAWGLPPDLARDAHAVTALQFDAHLALPAAQAAALTLCAVCAALGERVARGHVDEAGFDLATDPEPDIAALRPRLTEPPLQTLDAELRLPAALRLLGCAP
jgi:HD-like signal output (HDOD) protein